jgi:hypothetical protein
VLKQLSAPVNRKAGQDGVRCMWQDMLLHVAPCQVDDLQEVHSRACKLQSSTGTQPPALVHTRAAHASDRLLRVFGIPSSTCFAACCGVSLNARACRAATAHSHITCSTVLAHTPSKTVWHHE